MRRNPAAPISRLCVSTSVPVMPVMKSAGVSIRFCSMISNTFIPLSVGMLMSRMSRSNSRRPSSISASPPSCTVTTSYPASVRNPSISADDTRSSSTRRISTGPVGLRARRSSRGAGAFSSARSISRRRRSVSGPGSRFVLAAQHVGAILIAAQRRVGTSLLELQAHERAMDDFLRRIERQQPRRRLASPLPTIPRGSAPSADCRRSPSPRARTSAAAPRASRRTRAMPVVKFASRLPR